MSDTPTSPAGIPDPNAPSPAATGLAPNIAAGLACLFTIVGGIIFLVLEKKDKFVRFWAMQAAFLGGLAVAVSVALGMAHLVFDMIPVIGGLLMGILTLTNIVFRIAWFVVYVICVMKAFSNQEWEIPWLGKLARKQLEQMDGPTATAA
jgi:uncharacterized membrane protein